MIPKKRHKCKEGVIFRITGLWLLLVLGPNAFAQTQEIVQFSGVVLQADSISPLPGAIVIVPGTNRGATSNSTGFFSFPVLAGDDVEVRFVGLKTKLYHVAPGSPSLITYFAVMKEDTTYLPQVTTFGYKSLRDFQTDLLNYKVVKPGDMIDSKLINRDLMRVMTKTTAMDAGLNYKNYMGTMPGDIQNKFMPITNPFLNVANWARLIKKIRQQKKLDEAESAKKVIPD